MSDQLAGGINVRYRKSCGMCRNHLEVGKYGYCKKAFELDGNAIPVGNITPFYTARASAPDTKAFNEKYSVAPNMLCDEYFDPIRTRFPLD